MADRPQGWNRQEGADQRLPPTKQRGTLTMTDTINIRPAKNNDLAAITEIYNEAILHTTVTFDTEPVTVEEQRDWFSRHGGKCPILVAEVDQHLVGWASLSQWSGRCAYADTAEVSFYVKEGSQGKGLGRKLFETIIREGQSAGLHSVIARIAEGNEISVHLHESVGFQHVGVMKEVGRKFGRLLDVFIMQKIYDT